MGNRSFSDISDFIQDNDVKFVKFSFCDVFGRQKIISVLPYLLPRAFEEGVEVDASLIPGFQQTGGAIFLYPDTSTISLLPWRPSHGRVARFYCDIQNERGEALPQDSRKILQDAVEYARKRHVYANFGAENDFYLFRTDEEGAPTDVPFDSAGYMDAAPEDKGEDVRRDICLTLEDMGIEPLSSHHIGGPGQNRIDFEPAPALLCADNVMTFRSVVQTMAVRNGLWASFDPKPISKQPGSGFRVAMRPKKDGLPQAESAMAGILSHIVEMTAVLNPVESSYQRLGRQGAPGELSWSDTERAALLRRKKTGRIEISSPDGAANPYLTFALLLYAAVDGIDRELELPAGPAGALPETAEEAKALCRNSEFMKACLPREVLHAYTD